MKLKKNIKLIKNFDQVKKNSTQKNEDKNMIKN
jgi:hypothetical protein